MCKWQTLIVLAGASVIACSHHNATTAAAGSPRATAHAHTTTAPPPTHRRFAVQHFVGAERDLTEDVGILDVGGDGTLVVEKAQGDAASKLREAVATMNNARSISADGSNQGNKIERGKPGFFQSEREHLRKYYGFELTPL